ncbi:hypothetical protein [Undibacterium terreum]|uniref:Uncharacterized protein n=1 Tax=Undibacterium terreum TaxID=1224302 RepID=A0A916XNV0_9BURK|nr:hypothetical protein [Undibacterium terreum]GGC87647.1 hypothetical protein GCM10011396_38600 [Undibacterium terreum]
MKNLIEKICSDRRTIALAGLYCSSLLCWSVFYFWGADWLASTLDHPADEIQYRGLVVVVGWSIVRTILIWNGDDILSNWIDRER